MSPRFGTGVLFLAITTSIASRAHAYSTEGHHWPNTQGQPVVYRIDPAGTPDITDGSFIPAVTAAFQAWQAVSCTSISFMQGDWMGPKMEANDGLNHVFWKTQWTESPSDIALTYTYYRTADNVITDADITLNNVNWKFTTDQTMVGMGTPAKVDLQTVVTHEAGHFVGLDHSTDPTAVMYGINNQPIKRVLAEDDIKAICFLYPNGMPVPSMPGVPPTNGGPVGAPCQRATDCTSALCVNDGSIMRVYCSQMCTLTQTGACPSGFTCTQTPQGNFCLIPNTIDEMCDPCRSGQQCSSGYCVSVPEFNQNMGFCTRPCDPTPGQPAQCPSGYSCTAVEGQTGGACTPNTGVCEPVGRGGQDQTCFPDGSCKSGFDCVEYYPNSGLKYCYFACDPMFAGSSCNQGGGTRCTPVAMMTNVDVCFDVVGPGQRCIPAICDNTSFCAYDENMGISSALCYRVCNNGVSDCPAHEQCMGFAGLPNLCVPLDGFKYEGEPCQSDSECRSRLCRTYGQNSVCTSMCSITSSVACGPGLRCLPPTGQTQGFCWPESLNDPNAASPTMRDITSFCGCDVTNHCDSDCPCDPECKGCGCTAAPSERDSSALLAGAALMIVLGSILLSRRRRSHQRD
jgi:MYXO-CTERM domain-containing protein